MEVGPVVSYPFPDNALARRRNAEWRGAGGGAELSKEQRFGASILVYAAGVAIPAQRAYYLARSFEKYFNQVT
jgi:hypothetical protein